MAVFGNTLMAFSGKKLFLDAFSGAAVGWSLQNLKATTVFVIRVRRSSDNVEQDFRAIEIINGTLLAFVGANNGFVTIIYDQIGSNNMINNIATLQGQIVSNGSVILKGGKPCIIRSVDNNGGYLSAYKPNDGATVKGVFYVGDNEGRTSLLLGSNLSGSDYGFFAHSSSTSPSVDNISIITLTKINGLTTTISSTLEAFTKTNRQFLLYRESDFRFSDNILGLGYRRNNPSGFGMFTFQELVIFQNTNNTILKETEINSRYNIY
jgi:hypothetical protein